MDYTPAVAAFEQGEDPIAFDPPMHPSFEARPDVPDRVFAAVSPELGDHLVDAWARFLAGYEPGGPAPAPPLTAAGGVRAGGSRSSAGDPPPRHRDEDDRPHRHRRGPRPSRPPLGRPAARRRAGERPLHRDLPPRPRRGAAAARGGRRVDPQRRGHRAVRPRAAGPRRALRPLAAVAGGGSARLGRERRAREHPLLRGGHRGAGRPRHPGAAVRGAVPRLQARAAAGARLRGRARAVRAPGAAGDLGRLPGRVGGRAPAQRGRLAARARRVLRRLARPCRPGARAALLRRDGGAVGERAVRAGVPRGDGLRRAGDRHPQRRAAVVREHRAGGARTVDGGRGRRGASWPTRSWRR